MLYKAFAKWRVYRVVEMKQSLPYLVIVAVVAIIGLVLLTIGVKDSISTEALSGKALFSTLNIIPDRVVKHSGVYFERQLLSRTPQWPYVFAPYPGTSTPALPPFQCPTGWGFLQKSSTLCSSPNGLKISSYAAYSFRNPLTISKINFVLSGMWPVNPIPPVAPAMTHVFTTDSLYYRAGQGWISGSWTYRTSIESQDYPLTRKTLTLVAGTRIQGIMLARADYNDDSHLDPLWAGIEAQP